MGITKFVHFPKINKDVFLWGLYDFANTPLTAAMGGLFLAQWIVIDNGIDDIWYGGIFTLSTILLLLTSPFLGAWSDKTGKRIPFIKQNTFALVLIGSLLGLVTVSSIPRIPKVILALGLFFLLQYFYQVSLIFYNALMKSLSKPETIGKVSGIGQAFGEVGWLLGPALLLPFATKQITLFGEPGRGQVFFPAILVLILLGLPMVFWLKEKEPKKIYRIDLKGVYMETITNFRSLIRKNKNITTFLISFMFVSDALLTVTLYFAIYLDQIFKIPDTQKYIALALMEIVAIPSAYIIGRIGDRYGIKKVLMLSCVNLILVFFLISFTSSISFMYVLASFIGLGIAGFYTASRALLIKISPAPQLAEYFGFYSTFQKFASIIGPLTWGGITLLLKDYGVVRYRIAMFALAFLMLIGTLILIRVKEKRAFS